MDNKKRKNQEDTKNNKQKLIQQNKIQKLNDSSVENAVFAKQLNIDTLWKKYKKTTA